MAIAGCTAMFAKAVCAAKVETWVGLGKFFKTESNGQVPTIPFPIIAVPTDAASDTRGDGNQA
jgi:hypothetical protein